jgi:SAM-dependent methyltransferase
VRLPRPFARPETGVAEDRLETSELRLAGLEAGPAGTVLDVEVRESPALAALAPGWAGAEVRVGVHWLAADGAEVAWDGPRGDPIDLRWLGLRPTRRRISVGAPPDGATRARLDLVAEGVAWGSMLGLDTAEVALPQLPQPPEVAGPGLGPAAPEEDPAATREWLSSAWPQDARPQEMANYVGADLARFLMSAQLVPDPGRTLEIGANPYFITRLLAARHPDAELTLTNYFGGPEPEIEQAVVDAAGSEVARFRSDLVDIEAAPLPYPDESFDTALLCEVIEHLVLDPVHALQELARVLLPGGRLLLTTPNVARATNLHRLAQRQGIYDPYSRYGIHGRHNREYVAEELFELVSANGFSVERHLTRPVHAVPDPGPAWFAAADDDGAGDYHFLVARRGARVPPARPAWLYR